MKKLRIVINIKKLIFCTFLPPMENKHNTDIELESFFNRITTTSGVIIINICTYTVRYFSCVLYCCSEHIKYVRHWVGDDINVLLQNIQYKESDLIHREYLFLFNCNDAINFIDVFDDIKHFIGRLNKKVGNFWLV